MMDWRNYAIYLMAVWIAYFEGYFKPGSLAQRNRNPGNLRRWGDNPIVNGYAQFRTHEHGWEALFKQVSKNIDRDLTLLEFFAGKKGVYPGYAPAADRNNPVKYAEFISQKTGIPLAGITIKSFIDLLNRQLTN